MGGIEGKGTLNFNSIIWCLINLFYFAFSILFLKYGVLNLFCNSRCLLTTCFKIQYTNYDGTTNNNSLQKSRIRASTYYDGTSAINALRTEDRGTHADDLDLKTPCRLKILVRLVLWIIRRRHAAAAKYWLHQDNMSALMDSHGIYWLNFVEKDSNYKVICNSV